MLPDQPRAEKVDRLLHEQTGRCIVSRRLVTQNFKQPRRRWIGESHARKNLDTSSTRNLVGACLKAFLSEVGMRNDHRASNVPVAVNAFGMRVKLSSWSWKSGACSQSAKISRAVLRSSRRRRAHHAAHVVLLQAAMRPLACQPRITMQNFRHQYRWLVQDARHLGGSI